jgi:hypothetical protein
MGMWRGSSWGRRSIAFDVSNIFSFQLSKEYALAWVDHRLGDLRETKWGREERLRWLRISFEPKCPFQPLRTIL